MNAISTFSIVARDPITGDLGVATASKFLAVGAVVPMAQAGVGAIATQSYANTSFGPRTLAALAQDIPLSLIHQAYAQTDVQHALRQYGLVAKDGRSLSFTGAECHPWAGGTSGENYAAQGNLLAGPEVIEAMAAAFLTSRQAFPERLLAALSAGDGAGGDKRGRQSAALLVVRQAGGYGGLNDRYIDLRVDDHADPVAQLGRLLGLHRLYFEAPTPENRLPITGEVASRLRAVLERAGYLTNAGGSWDEAADKALRALAGVENLEERLLEPGWVDRLALEHLEANV